MWNCKACGKLNHKKEKKCISCKISKNFDPNAETKEYDLIRIIKSYLKEKRKNDY